MLKTGKIKATKHDAQEPLKIKVTNVMGDVEMTCNKEMQDVNENLRNGSCNDGMFVVDGDEAKGKASKVSNDEEIILQLRSELTEKADRIKQEGKLEICGNDEIEDDESHNDSEDMDNDGASLLERLYS